MNNKNKSKKIISLGVMLFVVMLLVSGSTYAYWTWVTADDERTGVALNISAPGLAASMTGHTQNITNLIPVTSCTNEDYAVMKEINLFYENLSTNDAEIYGTLSVENFNAPNGTPSVEDLSHLHYAVTTSSDSCTSNPVRGMSGVFTTQDGELFTNQKLVGPIPTNTDEGSATYYLWVWLDGDYTYKNFGSGLPSDPMQNLSFTLKWSGEIRNDLTYVKGSPNAPSLDYGMVPVKIANDGTVTTVAENDPTWYNYDNKEWANVVLVDSDSRNKYLNNIGITVNQDDIAAYYVWIPRYSYKIPEMTCSQITNPNEEEHIGCYKYSLTPEDKTSFITWWHEEFGAYLTNNFGMEYTFESATEDVETMLNTGLVYIEDVGSTYYFIFQISYYNEQNDPDINYESIFMSNNKVNVPRTIDISFESKNASVLTGDAINTYRTHPAFTFGNENVSGIWVGKFEASGDGTLPTVLPNLRTLKNQNVDEQFQTSLMFAGGTLTNGIVSFAGSNVYGLTQNTDSHMMKNSEWGAVAYLSHSIYGINEEIRINNYYYHYGFMTGCGALEPNASQTSECQIAYGGASSYPQSTTGNITGVFDMSGGAWEYTMGVLADDSGNPRSGNTLGLNSGFNGLLNDGSSYTAGIAFPIAKYYDLYTSNSPLTACNGGICYGHALSETSDWYGDYAVFVFPGYPWFIRGGHVATGVDAGAFFFYAAPGTTDGNVSWRSVCVVE